MADSGQRPDLSPYLVHLTRDLSDGSSARDNLVSILNDRCIEARNPHGLAVPHLPHIGIDDPQFLECQRVVCFSETPLEHLSGLVDPGIWRKYHFRGYGLAFEKQQLVDRGANPVWYLNGFRGNGFRWLSKSVNALIDDQLRDENSNLAPNRFEESEIARLTPYIEVMGEWPTGYGGTLKKDFSFEREWRIKGDFRFEEDSVAAIIVPPGKADSVLKRLAMSATRISRAHKRAKWLTLDS